jgi:hypothetical protein
MAFTFWLTALHRGRRWAVIASLGVLAAGCWTTSGSVSDYYIYQSIEEAVSQSDLVVVGSPTGDRTETDLDSETSPVVEDSAVMVDQYLKGTGPREISIRQTKSSEMYVRLKEDRDYVLFLRERDGHLRPGIAMGFEVGSEAELVALQPDIDVSGWQIPDLPDMIDRVEFLVANPPAPTSTAFPLESPHSETGRATEPGTALRIRDGRSRQRPVWRPIGRDHGSSAPAASEGVTRSATHLREDRGPEF